MIEKIKNSINSVLVFLVRLFRLDYFTPVAGKLIVIGVILFVTLLPIGFYLVLTTDILPPALNPIKDIVQSVTDTVLPGDQGSDSKTGSKNGGSSGTSGSKGNGSKASGSTQTGGSSGGGGGTNPGPTTPPPNPPPQPPPQPQPFVSNCLPRSGPRVNVSGLQKSGYRNTSVAANSVFNASSATWDGTDSAGTPIPWTIILGGFGSSCWYGGKYYGVWDDNSPSVTWEDPYHHAGAMTIRHSNFLVEGLRANNQGDGVRMEEGGSNFHIRGVHMSNIHDDCVENDKLHGGITEDSLFDGCYSGFSAASGQGLNGSTNTWTINNNLLYMKPFRTVHRVSFFTDRGCQIPNHMRLFKGWTVSNPGPRVVFNNNILRYDLPRCGGDPALLPGTINFTGCNNNTVVWFGSGPFPYTVPSCVRVTSDRNVWNAAVARWKQTHPGAAN